MAQYIVEIPQAYRARVGGNARITVEATSPMGAKIAAAQYGIPGGVLQLPVQVQGNVSSGSLPPTPGGTLDRANNPVYRSSAGANAGVTPTGAMQYGTNSNGVPSPYGSNPFFGTEAGYSNNFAPNVGIQPNQYNPDSTTSIERVNAAMGNYVPGTPGDPFYQPPAYQRLTPEYFAKLREKTGEGKAAADKAAKDDAKAAKDAEFAAAVKVAKEELADKTAKDAEATKDAKTAKDAETTKDASRSFSDTLKAIQSNEIALYSGGTFGSTPFEDPEFWDAAFETFDFAEGKEGDTRAAMLRAMAKQIAASSGGNAFEATRAVKEFYKQAESQMNSRGFGDLNLSDGGTLSTFAFAQQKTEKVEEVASTDQKKADADLTKSEFDLGTGGGAIGGEGEGFFPDSKTSGLVGNMTTFQPDPKPAQPQRVPEGTTSRFGMISIQDIIDTFEEMNGMPPTSQVPVLDEFNQPRREPDIQVAGTPASVGFPATDPYTTPGAIIYETVVNPLLARLLDDAEFNNGSVSEEAIYAAQNETQVEIAELRKEEALGVAYRNGVSAEAIAEIQRKGDYSIAIAQQATDKYLANQQLIGTQTQAGASSAFGFLQQGGSDSDLAQIYKGQNEVGLAEAAARESQAGAASLAARNNAFSFAAGQETFDPNQIAQIAANSDAAMASRGQTESARLQSEAQRAIAQIQSSVGLDQNTKEFQIAQIVDQTQRAVAAIQGGAQQGIASTQASGQLGSAQAAAGAASPYGFLQQGGTSNQLEQIFAGQNAVGMAQANPYGQTAADRQRLQETQFNPYALTNAQGYGLGQAQAANNPYAATQLGQDSARIDQILRGGLSAQQRLAEINASQSGQNFANQLNFMSNPSAIGFATEQGLFGGWNNQILQDINNSPEGNVPGSLFGFNSPTAAGAGGGTTQNVSGTGGNFNANTLRNASDEQIGFIQGAVAAGGQTPSEFNASKESFTPQGY